MNELQPFKVDGWTVFKTLLSSANGWPVWTAFVLGLILIASGCFTDVRYLVAGLMITVAVIPGIAALMYFSHTLSPQIVANLIPHTIERTNEGYILRLWLIEATEEDDTEENDKEKQWVEKSAIMLSDAKIEKREISFEYELLYFKDSPLKILYLPRLNNENIKEHQP